MTEPVPPASQIPSQPLLREGALGAGVGGCTVRRGTSPAAAARAGGREGPRDRALHARARGRRRGFSGLDRHSGVPAGPTGQTRGDPTRRTRSSGQRWRNSKSSSTPDSAPTPGVSPTITCCRIVRSFCNRCCPGSGRRTRALQDPGAGGRISHAARNEHQPGVGQALGSIGCDEVFSSCQRAPAGRPSYLVGEEFTAADLTFAALAAPAVLPPTYGSPLPTPGRGCRTI